MDTKNMYIGQQSVADAIEKNGRVNYKLENGSEGSSTKRQFDDMISKEPRQIDDLTVSIMKHTQDIADVLNAIDKCDLNYNEAQFVLQRALMSLTELQEQALCKVVGDAFNKPMEKLIFANDILLKEMNAKVK